MSHQPEQAAIQLALQRGYLNRAQVDAALRQQAQLTQVGRPTALLPLLRSALGPAQIAELSRVYQAAQRPTQPDALEQSLDFEASAATVMLPPGSTAPPVTRGPPPVALDALSAPTVQLPPGAVTAAQQDPSASSASRQRALLVESGVAVAPHLPPRPSSAPPTRLGRFEIQRELARGGMGVVYVARDPGLERQVAIKQLLPGAQVGPEHVARFRREGLAVARLKHPNIVSVYEVGEQEGTWYMVMDLVTGGTLQQKLEDTGGQGLEPEEAATIVRDLARATACAHANKVLHRDIKPHNVLFSESGVPKLTDFGLAKIQDAPDEPAPPTHVDHTAYQPIQIGAQPDLTQGGQLMGTPGYMSPEQAEGIKGAVDERTDVYGLGATLYALLTGRPPFVGETLLQLLKQLLSEAPQPPSRLRKGLDRRLDQICLKAVQRQPDARHAGASELADALEAWLERAATLQSTGKRRRVGGRPGASGRTTTTSSSRHRTVSGRGRIASGGARNRKGAASGRRQAPAKRSQAPVIVGLLSLGAIGWALVATRSPAPTPPEDTASASPTAHVGDVTPQTGGGHLDSLEPGGDDGGHWQDPPRDDPPADDPPRDDPPADDPPANDPPRDDPPTDDPPRDDPPADDPPTDDPPSGGNFEELWDRALSAADRGEFAEAERLLTQAYRASPMGKERDQLLITRGQVRANLRDFEGALHDANEVITRSPDQAEAYLLRGQIQFATRHPNKARRDLKRYLELDPRGHGAGTAREILEKLGERPPRQPQQPRTDASAEQIFSEGAALLERGDREGALQAFDRALAIDPNFTPAIAQRAGLLMTMGREDEAGQEFDRAIGLNPNDPNAYAYRAQLRRTRGDARGALADLDHLAGLVGNLPAPLQDMRDRLRAEVR